MLAYAKVNRSIFDKDLRSREPEIWLDVSNRPGGKFVDVYSYATLHDQYSIPGFGFLANRSQNKYAPKYEICSHCFLYTYDFDYDWPPWATDVYWLPELQTRKRRL